MASYFASTRDFVYRRRRPLVVVGGIVGGIYMVANYAITKLTDMQTRMVEERRDRENLRRRFAQNQEDCSFTILALLPTLGDQLFSHMDVEGLTAKLQRGRQSPTAAESKTPANGIISHSVPNGAVPAAVDESTTSLFDPSEKPDGSREAMEEIWSRLGQSTSTSSEQPISNGINGLHPPAIQRDAENQTETTAETQEQQPQHELTLDDHLEKQPRRGSSSALDAFSEPAPKPIPADARLTPSPSGTPTIPPIVERTDPSEKALIAEKSESSALLDAQPVSAAGHNVENGSTPSSTNVEKPEPTAEEVVAEKRQKLALWNELKITAFSRTITTIYSVVLLSLQTHVQLNLLGRYAYLSSVASLSASTSSSNHRIRLERHDGKDVLGGDDDEGSYRGGDDEDDIKGIDAHTERLYLTFSWWFLHEGWKELAQDVQEAVQDVLGSMPLKTQLTHQDFLLLMNKIRRRVEYEPRDEGADTFDGKSEMSEMTTTTTAKGKRGKRKTFMSVLFPPVSKEIEVLEKAGAIGSYAPGMITDTSQLSTNLPILLDETKDLLESKDSARIMRLCLNRVFEVFEGTLRPTFGVEPAMTTAEVDGLSRQSSVAAAAATSTSLLDSTTTRGSSRFQQLTEDGQAGIRVRLASLFPAVARQSSAAINGVPNEYVEALTEIKELKALSAVIYSSWS